MSQQIHEPPPLLPPPQTAPDAGWPLGAAFLDFMTDDGVCPNLFTDLMDPQTLTAVCTHNTEALGPPPLPPSDDTRKKLQAQDSDNGGSEGEEETGSKGKTGGNKRARSEAKSEANQTAKNKASREKARREKINDR